MYRLVICDDEDIIREGLCQCINWNELGFEVVANFDDGTGVLDYIKENPCDVVMTDIMMLNMTGLQLAKNIQENNPDIKVVILSGYKEFEYAKQAIQYGVVDYILKPFHSDEIKSIFHKVKNMIDEEKESKKQEDLEVVVSNELKAAIKNNFFKALLSGMISSKQELEISLKHLDINYNIIDSPVYVYSININSESQEGKENIIETCERLELLFRHELASKVNDYEYYIILEAPYQYNLIVIDLNKKDNCIIEISNDINKVQKSLTDMIGTSVDIELSISVKSMHEFFGQGNNDNIDIQILKDIYNEESFISLMSKYKMFIMKINDNDKEGLKTLFDSYVEELDSIRFEHACFMIKYLFSTLVLSYKSNGIDVVDAIDGKFDYYTLLMLNTKEKLYAYAKEYLEELFDLVEINSMDRRNFMIERIKQYLLQNISRDITTEEVAKIAHMNVSYFGRYFKKQTGEFLSEYILRIRIEKAIQLLTENKLKANEIGKIVGFSNPKYFYSQFKKYTGYTTTEYCRFVLSIPTSQSSNGGA